MKKIYVLSIILLVMAYTVQAQDIHYSQFYASPLNLNPAAAGAFYGDYRFAANYRNQWSALGTPYNSTSISYDMKLFKRQLDGNYVGVGVIMNNERAGDAGFGNLQVNAALSFNKTLNADQTNFISVGMQYGYAQRSVNFNNMTWDNEWQDGAFNPNLVSYETINQSFWYSDLSAGLMWNYNPSLMTKFSLGFGLLHVNEPSISFISNSSSPDLLYKRYVIHTTDFFAMSEAQNVYLVPSIMYTWQGPSKELDFGTFLMYIMTDRSRYTKFRGEIDLSFGLFMRSKDAVMPTIRFGVRNLAVGISYDVNTSKLSEATGGSGAFEFSLIYANRITKSHFRRGAPKATRFL